MLGTSKKYNQKTLIDFFFNGSSNQMEKIRFVKNIIVSLSEIWRSPRIGQRVTGAVQESEAIGLKKEDKKIDYKFNDNELKH